VRDGRCDCPPGTIRLPNGYCCPREQVHDGRCDQCPRDTILVNGKCCPREQVHDGRCDQCPPNTIMVNGKCCPREYVHNGQCCPPTAAAAGCQPPSTCPPGQIQLPNGQCCPREQVHNGQCVPLPVPRLVPQIDLVPGCTRGRVRLPGGGCGYPTTRIERIPGRLHIDRTPHHRPEKPTKPPKRERTVTPNWKPTGGTTRLNTFHPQVQGGSGMHRGR
jgi:hypothetical protein